MIKLNNIESFNQLKNHLQEERKKVQDSHKKVVRVCTGGGCIASGSLSIRDAFIQLLEKENLTDSVRLVETGCLGPCSMGPAVMIDDVFYEKVKAEDVEELVKSHLAQNKMVERLLPKEKDAHFAKMADIPYFQKQVKIVLRNCGKIDPKKIDDYIAINGYAALAKVLQGMSSDQVVDALKISGLRGRGGAGFPTWMKWNFTRQAKDPVKYVLCNADEGDPGAFMDRSILEGDPHSVIEGMAIAGYTIHSNQGYVYVRAEYPLAVERLNLAIKQAREYGLLGEHILGTDFSFDLEIRMGSGAFVCGEETALITSIEGNRGEPRPRPPFPAVKGLWQKPTLLNNVETYTNVPAIIDRGAQWYASYGTDKSKGTKVFALAGSVKNSGLAEIPVGTKLGELVYDIGGGTLNNRPFKAAQIGGPSGGCIPKNHLDVPMDYESLADLGAIMGSGGLIVLDESSCMVDVARYFLEFVQDESCGKCVPCRVGTKRMLEILEQICAGEGKLSDIDLLIEIGNQIKDTALCGLGQTAANPVLSTICHFKHEYLAHILEKKCPAGTCSALVKAPCRSGCPANVNVPGFISLVGEKRYDDALKLHREQNPLASICARVCFHPCEEKCRRTTIDSPVAVKDIKRFMVEQEKDIQLPEIRVNPENARRKVAVIGAGPAGLSCAYFLARLGYKPTIFEAKSQAGGMLVQAIPTYRLPRKELAKEIKMITDMGCSIQFNKTLGKDVTFDSLKQAGFEAVFVGIGAAKGIKLGLPNEDVKGVMEALPFLEQFHLNHVKTVGKRVVVIGGGNSAFDSARVAIRLGAEKVTVVYRRTQEEITAYYEEINAAVEEGVELQLLTAPAEIMASGDHITAVKCNLMKLGEYDKSGRRKPIPSGETITLEADQVIVAVSQQIDTTGLEGNGFTLNKNGTIAVNQVNGQTSADGIFAGGDVAVGPSSVVEAIAWGEKAAVGIDQFLSGEDHAFWREDKMLDTFFDPDADPIPDARAVVKMLDPKERKTNFEEVETCWSAETACIQAKRCLRCDYGK